MIDHPGFWIVVGIWVYLFISMTWVHKLLMEERKNKQKDKE